MSQKQINSGGPAFPRSAAWSPGYEPVVSNSQTGMSMRDYFAAKAMQSYMGHISSQGHIVSQFHEEMARESFRIADAMIAARSKPEGTK